MLFRSESKGVLASVISLFVYGNVVVAALLALFSVIIPVSKLALGLLAASKLSPKAAAWAARVLHHIGKWSMTDVFVVAVLLAFLAGSAGDSTDAWTGHGLWFFAAYGLLSLIATQRLEKAQCTAGV